MMGVQVIKIDTLYIILPVRILQKEKIAAKVASVNNTAGFCCDFLLFNDMKELSSSKL
jgi:hypothetical protein